MSQRPARSSAGFFDAGSGGPAVTPLDERLRGRDGSPPSAAPFGGRQAVRNLFAPTVEAAPAPQPAPPSAAQVASTIEFRQELARLRDAAEAEGLRAGEAKVDAACERYLDGVQRLARRTIEAPRPAAEEVVSLALVVARQILGRELLRDTAPLLHAIEEALLGAQIGPGVHVRLGRADLESIKRRRGDLVAAGAELILDETLGPGDCIVETPHQVVDASIAARLEATRGALVELLREPAPVEPPQESAVAC